MAFVTTSLFHGSIRREVAFAGGTLNICRGRRVRAAKWEVCAGPVRPQPPTATTTTITTTPTEALPRYFNTYIWRGHKINYLEEGSAEGEPVILIHGFGASINHWRKNIPAILKTDDLRVYAVDLLGFGGSDKPSSSAVTYSIELWTELVCEFVEAINPTRKWSFVGNSIGSLVSLAVAERLGKERVRCCALMNCAGGMVSFRYSELNMVQATLLRLFNLVLLNSVIGPKLFNYIRQKKNLVNVLKQVYIDETAVSDELVEILTAPAMDDGACDVFLAVLNGDAGPKPEDLLKNLGWCPVLALWGEKDLWTPLEAGLHPGVSFPEYHNGLILQSIPNAGHCIHDECPQVVNNLLVPFLLAPRLREDI